MAHINKIVMFVDFHKHRILAVRAERLWRLNGVHVEREAVVGAGDLVDIRMVLGVIIAR